jgi:redox-regulated HSP33 family molecular chaperone
LTLVISSLYVPQNGLNVESMKTLLSVILAVVMLATWLLAANVNVDGNWEMTMDSPHGKLTGPLMLQQDGTKLTGSFETEHTGKLAIKGNVDGEKIMLTMEVPGGQMTITFDGIKDGDKLSGTTKPLNGEWSAVRK